MFLLDLATPLMVALIGSAACAIPWLFFVIKVATPTFEFAAPFDIRMMYLFGGLIFVFFAVPFLASPFELGPRGLIPNWVYGTFIAVGGVAGVLTGSGQVSEEVFDELTQSHPWHPGTATSKEKNDHLDRFFKAVEERQKTDQDQR